MQEGDLERWSFWDGATDLGGVGDGGCAIGAGSAARGRGEGDESIKVVVAADEAGDLDGSCGRGDDFGAYEGGGPGDHPLDGGAGDRGGVEGDGRLRARGGVGLGALGGQGPAHVSGGPGRVRGFAVQGPR